MMRLSSAQALAIVTVMHLALVIAAYFLDLSFIQFIVGVPWSGVVAVALPLLGHMFGSGAGPIGILIVGVVNSAILLRFTIVKHVDEYVKRDSE